MLTTAPATGRGSRRAVIGGTSGIGSLNRRHCFCTESWMPGIKDNIINIQIPRCLFPYLFNDKLNTFLSMVISASEITVRDKNHLVHC